MKATTSMKATKAMKAMKATTTAMKVANKAVKKKTPTERTDTKTSQSAKYKRPDTVWHSMGWNQVEGWSKPGKHVVHIVLWRKETGPPEVPGDDSNDVVVNDHKHTARTKNRGR